MIPIPSLTLSMLTWQVHMTNIRNCCNSWSDSAANTIFGHLVQHQREQFVLLSMAQLMMYGLIKKPRPPPHQEDVPKHHSSWRWPNLGMVLRWICDNIEHCHPKQWTVVVVVPHPDDTWIVKSVNFTPATQLQQFTHWVAVLSPHPFRAFLCKSFQILFEPTIWAQQWTYMFRGSLVIDKW